MRILQVKLANLNSLRGEHTIDFAGEPLGSAGIFAITGPTGAGKSTILDAITLALYGRAARYGSEANPEHMMSRHTGECSAEVFFEIPSGQYRAVWQLRRARGAADGKLQPAKRYLYDSAGQVLAEKLREADRRIEELCGLDYDRFMRSVLLAQGEFARFLKARADDRAALLESLTGTGIYSQLSELAHREGSRRSQELLAKERELGLIELFSEEERKKREGEVVELGVRRDAEKKVQDVLSVTIARSLELQAQLKNETEIRSKQAELRERREGASADLARLAHHQKATPFLPGLSRVEETVEARARRSTEREEAENLFRQAEEERIIGVHAAAALSEETLAAQDKLLRERRGQVAKLEGERKTAEEWLAENARDKELTAGFAEIVESLTKLANIRATRRTGIEEARSLERELAAEGAQRERLVEALKTARDALAKSTGETEQAAKSLATLEAGRELEALQAKLDQQKERGHQIRALQGLEERREVEAGKLASGGERIKELNKHLGLHREQLKRALGEEGKAGKLLKSYQEHLATAQKVASLEEHRAQLQEGEACPLCGATDHPYASGEEKPPEIQSLECQIAEAEGELRELTASVSRSREAVTRSETELESAERQREDARAEAGRLAKRISEAASMLQLEATDRDGLAEALAGNQDAVKKHSELVTRIEAARAAHSVAEKAESSARNKVEKAELAEAGCRKALEKLRGRVELQKKRVESLGVQVSAAEKLGSGLLQPFGVALPNEGSEADAKKRLEARRDTYVAKQERLRKVIENLKDATRSVADAEKERTFIEAIHERLTLKREAADFGDRPVPDELVRARRDGWSGLEDAEAQVDELERAVERAEATLKERRIAERNAGEAVSRARDDLEARLVDTAFADLDALRAARLETREETRLLDLKAKLDDAEKNLGGRLQESRESIERLKSEETASGEALEALNTKKREVEEALQSLIAGIATLREELRRDDQSRKKQEEQERALKAERDRMKAWDLLQRLIGSHDGRKFRRFAQGITLDVLIRHANQHLERLTDRYALRRTAGQELELEIVDLFQAGAARPMTSLSGGESFLASLALALGLSDLAGRNVQIDSLFIDEGFGALDSESLDVALSALEVLRLDNKTVGVISHVDVLKERITTQIVVSKLPGGVSRLAILPAVPA